MEMQTYVGTKIIKAVPMNRDAYNTLRGWPTPPEENGADEGYLVEYQDGGKANHPDFANYISWSPKDVFEKSYRVANTPLDRVIIERDDLKEKLGKLTSFMTTSATKISEEHRKLLFLQQELMDGYAEVLDARIANFDK
jgi:hypothetical protein